MVAPRPFGNNESPADLAGKTVRTRMIAIVVFGILDSFISTVQPDFLLKSRWHLSGGFAEIIVYATPPVHAISDFNVLNKKILLIITVFLMINHLFNRS
jgi:hypothetical protein